MELAPRPIEGAAAPTDGGAAATPDLDVVGLTKRYGAQTVVDGVSFSLLPGEFVSILGPSGCGKTTTLRIIAGLEEASEGTVRIKGRDVTHLAPEKRNTAMVFQSYALFPHMDVLDNVAFGLRMRGVAKAEARERARHALERARLVGFDDRRPSELSGGQRQRVAVARALVVEPDVLLLDEALTNLDRRLRQDLQLELKRLQQELGITSLFVTHDQEEALTLSDRVIVMEEGRIAQVDEPSAIYDRPASVFVAGFIGESNRLSGRVTGRVGGGFCEVTIAEGQAIVGHGEAPVGTVCAAVVRPRNITLAKQPQKDLNCLPGTVVVWGYKGDSYEYVVQLADGPQVKVMVPRREATADTGDAVFVVFDRADVYVLPDGS